MQKEFRGVADPDQAWILGELIRYLEHPRSGAMEFDDMGESWVSTRDAVHAGTLRATDKGASEVSIRFDALLRFASLRLGRQLGTEVTPALTRRELSDPAYRTQTLVEELVKTGTLTGAIRIPATVGDVVVTADLRARSVTCHVDVAAPREGRATTRVRWLIRQLKGAPDALRIEARAAHERGHGAADLLHAVRDAPERLVLDPSKDLRVFRVALSSAMGSKRGRGRGTFIDSVLDLIDSFYVDVVQDLKAWSAAPPRMRPETEVVEEPVAPELVSTALSSQDDEVFDAEPAAR